MVQNMSRKRRKKPQKPQTLIDICIPVYGQFDLLARCLDAIPDALGDLTYQVFLFDNDSPKIVQKKKQMSFILIWTSL
jgi:hypothetical protein